MRYLNDSVICYLSPKASDTVKSLVALYNMDLDLAVEVTVILMKEEDCWELPTLEEVEHE